MGTISEPESSEGLVAAPFPCILWQLRQSIIAFFNQVFGHSNFPLLSGTFTNPTFYYFSFIKFFEKKGIRETKYLKCNQGHTSRFLNLSRISEKISTDISEQLLRNNNNAHFDNSNETNISASQYQDFREIFKSYHVFAFLSGFLYQVEVYTRIKVPESHIFSKNL